MDLDFSCAMDDSYKANITFSFYTVKCCRSNAVFEKFSMTPLLATFSILKSTEQLISTAHKNINAAK